MSKKSILQNLPKPTHYDEEVEKALLGSILVSGKHSLEVMDSLSSIITHNMFYLPVHQQVYFLMLMLWQSSQEVCTISLVDMAREYDYIEIDQRLILTLAAKSSLLASTKTAANIIKRLHVEREILAINDYIKDTAKNQSLMEGGLDEIQKKLDEYTLKKEGVSIRSSEDMFSGIIQKLLDRATDTNFKPSISTGISKLDDKHVSFAPGDLIVVAGRPGNGKTALAAQLIDNFSQRALHSFFFSLEMTEVKMRERMLAFKAGISPTIVDKLGFPGSEQATQLCLPKLKQAEEYWKQTPYQAVFSSQMDLWKLIETVKILHKKKTLDAVIIDQLSEITTGNMFKLDDTLHIRAHCVTKLKQLAIDLGIPIILLHQLKRPSETKLATLPSNADLKDTGTVEEKADTILLLHREEKDDKYKVLITKNRNGPTGIVDFSWDKKLARMTY